MSFEEALRASEELLLEIEKSGTSNPNVQNELAAMLSGLASCRGFFVTYLTGDSPLSDDTPEFILSSLDESEHMPELLAKNLVMSVTMQITHERKGDATNAAGSAQVARRSADLIRNLKSPMLRTKLNEMRLSIKTRAGVFADFLKRWGYDDEQLAAASAAIDKALS